MSYWLKARPTGESFPATPGQWLRSPAPDEHQFARARVDCLRREQQDARHYLRLFEKAVAESPNAATAREPLLAAYPNAELTIAAEIGTKVARRARCRGADGERDRLISP